MDSTPKTKYTARTANATGVIEYTDDEHKVWQELLIRQQLSIQGKACNDYMDGLALLGLSERMPKLTDIDTVLAKTGWRTCAVPALIGFGRFFELLAHQQFPVATFIRSRQDFDYIQEPDIFHEIVGHCPLLTHSAFATFTHTYGKLGLASDKHTRIFLARLYWFTMEFGLIDTDDGRRIYGGGILSSPSETDYALSGTPEYRPFDLLDILRTPYRIDRIQPIYYVLDNPSTLFNLDERILMNAISQAQTLGLYAPHPSCF
ncbi:MAG: phenylalanine 4-monooxygenase [Moraxella sp.]|nr:phenylalanine 4-monooxygenase [Moraxella sp.]